MSVVIHMCFELPEGGKLEREFTMEQMQNAQTDGAVRDFLSSGPPDWLENPSRAWPHPRGPLEFKGTVKPGHEDEAKAAVEAL